MNSRIGIAARPAVCLLAVLSSWPVVATEPPSPPAAVIEADQAEFDNQTGVGVYRGDVRATRQDLHLKGNKLTVYSQAGKLTKAVTVGQPATMDRDTSQGQKAVHGEARRIEYYAQEDRVVLIDDALLTRDRDRFSGHQITYKMSEEQVLAEGAATEGERVHVTIHPEDKGSNDSTE